ARPSDVLHVRGRHRKDTGRRVPPFGSVRLQNLLGDSLLAELVSVCVNRYRLVANFSIQEPSELPSNIVEVDERRPAQKIRVVPPFLVSQADRRDIGNVPTIDHSKAVIAPRRRKHARLLARRDKPEEVLHEPVWPEKDVVDAGLSDRV